MKRWKVITGLILIFVLGALVGALGMGVFFKYRHPLLKRGPVDRTAFIMKRLTHKLDLTDAQRRQVEEIVERRYAIARKRFNEHRTEMKAFFDQTFAEIRKVLNPKQQVKLDEMRQEFERRRKEREKRGFHR